MTERTYTQAVETARGYYNSEDADRFYHTIWGGEDIHVGLYEGPQDTIYEASRRTVHSLANRVEGMKEGARVIDLGAGYGGTGRFLARELGCEVVCLNLSEVENERNRKATEEAGLTDKVKVVDGSFEEIPFANESFDVAWSQDSIVHSGERERVFREINRVLKPGGEFIMTDLMQDPGADPENMQPVLERIHLDSMGSIEVYTEYAKRIGWEVVGVEELRHQLVNHYSRVHDEMKRRASDLDKVVSTEYQDRMKRGLQHWVDAGQKGNITWGVLHFRKPAK